MCIWYMYSIYIYIYIHMYCDVFVISQQNMGNSLVDIGARSGHGHLFVDHGGGLPDLWHCGRGADSQQLFREGAGNGRVKRGLKG